MQHRNLAHKPTRPSDSPLCDRSFRIIRCLSVRATFHRDFDVSSISSGHFRLHNLQHNGVVHIRELYPPGARVINSTKKYSLAPVSNGESKFPSIARIAISSAFILGVQFPASFSTHLWHPLHLDAKRPLCCVFVSFPIAQIPMLFSSDRIPIILDQNVLLAQAKSPHFICSYKSEVERETERLSTQATHDAHKNALFSD